MKSILNNIQDTVVKYANIIAQVIELDIEIVDSNMVRIAGTGKYMDIFNICVEEEGHIYSQTFKTGETQIVDDPVKNKLCKFCSYRDTCIEKLVASTPIKIDDEVIGLIGIVCFTDEKKEKFLSNLSTYSSFLEQISDFISTKAYETLENQRSETMVKLLNSIMEKLDDAIIVLNKESMISHMNKVAEEIFNMEKNLSEKVKLEPTGNFLLDQPEYELKFGKSIYLVVGNLNSINIKEKQYDKIFIFNETRTIKEKFSTIATQNQNITLDQILGNSSNILILKKKVLQIAKSTSTILITGESGTGKEMFARAIHSASNRKTHPFVAINCGAIPDSLLESELFGYGKGAFTGANQNGKIGKFEFADNGTIFLDEIGDMPLYMQVKLLRALQEKEIVRIGSNKPIKINVRIIAATNKSLEQMVVNGTFRKDLYYRLNVIPLEIPPLRERYEDIKLLIQYFCKKYADLFDKKFTYIEEQTLQKLLIYDWPGNIRELENTVEFMINMMDMSGIITHDILPQKFFESTIPLENYTSEDLLDLAVIEKNTIEKALKKYGNHAEGKKIASDKLGIGIATLYRKISKYGL